MSEASQTKHGKVESGVIIQNPLQSDFVETSSMDSDERYLVRNTAIQLANRSRWTAMILFRVLDSR